MGEASAISVSDSCLLEALKLAEVVSIEVGTKLRAYLEDRKMYASRPSADREAEDEIRSRLTRGFPSWGFRAEEAPELNEIVSDSVPFWLVDPNDGTSAFLKGERGASVSIALIERGQPILGVVFAYAAPNGLGDLFTWARGVSPLMRNGHKISTQWQADWSSSTIFVSNSADRISAAYQNVLSQGQDLTHHCQYRVAPGIAYRLALCAVGEGEVAISLASPRDFDFAAGHALLLGAGGVLLDEKGEEVNYIHHRPARLGFAFGGSRSLCVIASKLNWHPTLDAQKRPLETPFLPPSEVKLCENAELLNRAQGAWWGWHIGEALSGSTLIDAVRSSRESGSSLLVSLRDRLRAHGGDGTLVKEARQFISGEAQLDQCLRLLCFIKAIEESESADLPSPSINMIQNASSGAQVGVNFGRRGLPVSLVSALLGWRTFELDHMDQWQPDGDRLIEQLLHLSTRLRIAFDQLKGLQ